MALALQTLTRKASCSYCGKESADLKRCWRCKRASFCGAECQNAAWKQHKKRCESLLSVGDDCDKVAAAQAVWDLEGVLK